MKYIKIFEDFFKFNLHTIVEDKEIWGYSREEIEDYFVHIEDDLKLSISIDFVFKHKDGRISYRSKKDIIEYSDGIKSGEVIPVILIVLYVSSHSLEEFGIKEPYYWRLPNKYKKKYYEYLSMLSSKINKMLNPIFNGRIQGYSVKSTNYIPEDIKDFRSNILYTNSEYNIEYGDMIYSLILEKITK